MIFTNVSGNLQPYISWKGKSTYSVIPKLSKPIINNSTDVGVPFKPRPIKHWRKQLNSTNTTGNSRTSYTITFDKPGSSNYLGINYDCNDNVNKNYIINNISNTKNTIFGDSNNVIGPNKKSICIVCNPEKNIIKSGRTEKLINPVDSQSEPKQKYNFNTKSYLKSKCALYEQRLTGIKIEGNQYIIPGTNEPAQPSNNILGSQVRNTLDCSSKCNKPIKIIYKPNNSQYGTQGAVSSSSRIQRLKLNTINKNAASFATAWGAAATNAGKYSSNVEAPYFIKSKNNNCYETNYHIKGNKKICK